MSFAGKYRALMLAAAAAMTVGGCQTVAKVVGNNFAANLSGASEVPPGDPDGVGTARIAINDATNQICTHLEVRNIGPVTAAHIHSGRAGTNGPPVVNLDPPDDLDSDDCDTRTDRLVDDIRRDPAAFYVNVHTAEHPDGAIRGQVFNVKD